MTACQTYVCGFIIISASSLYLKNSASGLLATYYYKRQSIYMYPVTVRLTTFIMIELECKKWGEGKQGSDILKKEYIIIKAV